MRADELAGEALVFRGEFAAASLKLELASGGVVALDAVFRGEFAAASLKPVKPRIAALAFPVFRGEFAAASLKRLKCPRCPA